MIYATKDVVYFTQEDLNLFDSSILFSLRRGCDVCMVSTGERHPWFGQSTSEQGRTQ